MSVSTETTAPFPASRLNSFKKWLTDNNAEILAPTNPYERLRFRCAIGTGIVYENAGGLMTATGAAVSGLHAFKAKRAPRWEGNAPKPRRKFSDKMRRLMRSVELRDGNTCFYCGEPTTEEDRTIEHLLARGHQGPDNIHNMALAHEGCNRDAGNLSVMEKIKLREERVGR